MKTLSLLILSLISGSVLSQQIPEKEIKSKVNEVTVFLDGAQIVRKKQVDLSKGKTIVKFVNLSPFIDARSIQVKAEGNLTVLSVNHQQNYLNKAEKSAELKELETRLETIEDKIKLENTQLSIISEELAFLKENRDIGGKNVPVSLTNLQQAADFYGTRLTALKMKEIDRNKTLRDLNRQKSDLQSQIKSLAGKKEFPAGEIQVKVDAKTAGRFPLEISYLVGNAGWFPSYDIRAKNINVPIQLIYKANVKQDTKIDWENVKLKFSSAEPNASGVAPELQTYYLNYNTRPPSYKMKSNNVSGKVMDSDGEPLPGATILVDGTTIGTVSDADGNYSITIPGSSSQLTYSYIGFETQTLPVSGSVMNVALKESAVDLDEVVVVRGISSRKNFSNALSGKVAGVSVGKSKVRIRGTSSLAIPTARVENQTTVDFEIQTPYTINSDNKNYTVDMETYELPALYQYYCVPKVDRTAFLIANIADWEKYNLLEGEASVFFEDTYVGKSLLDVRYANDTLQISLGRDKQVSVNREKIKDYTTRQFIGNKKEETRAYKTSIRNNKTQDINLIVLDQVPVSTNEDIEVNVQNISGAVQNPETGEVKWEFLLKPSEKKELQLKYSVKYPKYRSLIVE